MSESPSSEPERRKAWRVALIGFEHMHAGDQIAVIKAEPGAELVAVWGADPAKRDAVCDDLGVDPALRYGQLDELLGRARPEIAVVCSTTSEHGSLTAVLAAAGCHVLLEKPLALGIGEAAEIAGLASRHAIRIGVNWPLAWYPAHRTTKRLIDEGMIGEVTEVHYYDGNRGPLFHGHGKKVLTAAEAAEKADSWWYQKTSGGGSMRDYLGYGTTLGTWFRAGELPRSVTATVHLPPGLEVDEQSIVVARYGSGLSSFQTRWGTFTDPWTHQPSPRCGFVVAGSGGTIASFDYAESVRVQTIEHPAGFDVPTDDLPAADANGLANLLAALDAGRDLDGPISLGMSYAGQRVVEAALLSAERGVEVPLAEVG